MVKLQKENVVVCKYCQRTVMKGAKHQCAQMRAQSQPARTADDEDGDFFVSFVLAYATDDWAFGLLGGGNLIGAIVGAALAEDVDYDIDKYEDDFTYDDGESTGRVESADGDLPPIDELDEIPEQERFLEHEPENPDEPGDSSYAQDTDDTPGDTSDSY